MNQPMKPEPADASVQPTEATRNRVTLAPMSQDDLDAVIAIEQTAYSHPWTRGNFQWYVRLTSGYRRRVWRDWKDSQYCRDPDGWEGRPGRRRAMPTAKTW